jgi:hypothetical protein
MAVRKIVYPKSLKDIPLWRQRQLAQDIRWFSRFSPVERLRYIDREWEEIQNFIDKFAVKRHGSGIDEQCKGSFRKSKKVQSN